MTEHQFESKENFHIEIRNYFLDLAENLISTDLLNRLIDKITDTQYDNYKRFWNQYPKSRKRYSGIKLEDLEHPFIHYEITDFLKNNDLANYKKFSMILLKMTDDEFIDYELKKYQYETK